MSNPINPVKVITPFSEQIRNLGRGSLDAELTELYAEAVRELVQTGGTAKLILEISIHPADKSREHMVVEPSKVELKLPKTKREASILYAASDGDLLRDDPRDNRNQRGFSFGTATEAGDVMPHPGRPGVQYGDE